MTEAAILGIIIQIILGVAMGNGIALAMIHKRPVSGMIFAAGLFAAVANSFV
jgi:hypothetical protein